MATQPKRVLHVMNAAVGGAALSTIALMRGLKEHGIDSAVVCHSMVGESETEKDVIREATDGRALFTPLYWWNEKIRVDLWKRPILALRQSVITQHGVGSAARVAAYARRHGADTIHTNTMVTPEGGRAARLLGLPHVWHVRELVGPKEPTRLPFHGAKLARYLSSHASVVLANSPASAERLAPFLPPSLLRVVNNGIDLQPFDHLLRKKAKRSRVVVGMVGNVTSLTKKHALFIEAAARVDAPNVEFRIYGYDNTVEGRVGSGYGQELRVLAQQLGVTDRLVWGGFVSEPPRIMEELDIVVHPADNESFGRVVVEAMAAGLPVVGARGGGVGEIVQDGVTGVLAEPDDADSFARGIDALARSAALRRKYGRAGRARAEAMYSIDACVAGVMSAYEVALQNPVRSILRRPFS